MRVGVGVGRLVVVASEEMEVPDVDSGNGRKEEVAGVESNVREEGDSEIIELLEFAREIRLDDIS